MTTSAAPTFPKLLQMPAIERPVNVPVADLADVKSAADLPSRLLLGDLVAASFKPVKKGWTADWRDADGHLARFRYAGGLSSLELSFAGDETVTLVSASRFGDLGASVQGIHPGAWLARLGERLEAMYNLRVFPHREDDAVGGDFPDGHLVSLVLPVPADRLMALFDLHKALREDAAIRTPVDAYLRYAFSTVNYVEGRCHPMLAHPAGLVLHHVNALGTPAAEMPVRELDPQGVAAWTLQRGHYLYVAHCRLREAARLVERLAAAGFIGAADTGKEGWPYAPEFGAALLPFGYEYAAANAWWFDKAGSRRIFYARFADADDRQALGGHSGDIWLKALIRDAAKAADQCRVETARAFAEGMAEAAGKPAGQAH
ncbi:hypothetical protein EZJ19_14365 [Parasulfuritortus cantonensis]|uniref:Uncharacterized protein n=1 Tax=Parasulfuritortus cantonensis TaxID=2528202 RepID=A0A4R1B5P8_9PROT|nr:hypothetical protein [Parasulfuritortus cantonensis]TCJ11837.1 hypothetical protein EZJ19_14365 [Parasulfuritortus cantonensis]